MANERRGVVRRFLDGLLDVGAVGWLCIYPLGCAVAALIFFVFVPQGHELLRVLIENSGDGGRGLCALTLYFAASAALATGIWYAARILLTRRFVAPARLSADSVVLRAARAFFPELLALIALLPAILIGFLTGESLAFSAAGVGVTLVVMVAIARSRGLLANVLHGTPEQAEPPRAAPTADARAVLPRQTKAVIAVWGALAAALLIAFSVSPVTLPRWFGSATIVLLALLGWTIFGSFVLVLWPKSYGWPSLAVLAPLLLIAVSSRTNDNHWPREAPETIPAADAARELRRPIAEHFDRWIGARKLEGGTYPVFIVAAEGGGLRAAYWTASVLGRLQDKWPGTDRFSDHVFAISAVSGGGLGAAVFAGLVAEADRGLDPTKAREGCENPGYAELARCILNDDFLSPTLAALLFSDLIQQFVPYPMHWADRARALEQAWESSWNAVTGSDLFAAQFEELWRQPGGATFAANYGVPSLLINGTVVEDGRRIVFSNLAVTTDFIEAYEGTAPAAVLTRRGRDPLRSVAKIGAIPVSTFVHMGARFTFVSPAARLERHDDDCRGCLWGRVVDGGYHENSGAATAFDVLQALVPVLARHRSERGATFVPYVILITNDPDGSPVLPFITGDTEFDGAPSKPPGSPWLPELLSPIDTVLSARESRSPYARNVLARLARRLNQKADGTPPDHPHVFEFYLERKTSDPALGWTLSGRSDLSMDLALGTGHNLDEVARVVELASRR
jgi:hypothetical protein